MKKLIVIACMVTMVMGLAVVANAGIDTDWLISLRAANSVNAANGKIDVGTKSGHVDTYTTASGQDAAQSAGSGARGYITSNVNTGITAVGKDSRAPLAANEVKTWNLKMWLVDSSGAKAAGDIILTGWISATANMYIDAANPVPVTVTVGSQSWTVPTGNASLGTSVAPLKTFDAVAYDGINDINVTVTAGTAVPEPGSIVAMLSGLVGLAGYGIRRRK